MAEDTDSVRIKSQASLEDKYRQITFDFWRDIIPLGFVPVGLSLKSVDTSDKKINVAKENED